MEHTFKYTILRASPDPRRGERVNVGIIVFMPDRLDVRFAELRKLQALTGRKWERYATDYQRRVTSLFVEGSEEGPLLKRIAGLENVILPSEFGWLTAKDHAEYETRVNEILATFIRKPITERPAKEPRLNTEIADEFRRVKILAGKDEGLESHKVLRNFPIEEGLPADFVVKNGVYHVTATLDFRKIEVPVAEAALKAVVLDRARTALSPDARRIGVYALEVGDSTFQPHIHVLTSYADETFNWSDPDERRRYQHQIYDAVHQH
jgi:hypothetical protein